MAGKSADSLANLLKKHPVYKCTTGYAAMGHSLFLFNIVNADNDKDVNKKKPFPWKSVKLLIVQRAVMHNTANFHYFLEVIWILLWPLLMDCQF